MTSARSFAIILPMSSSIDIPVLESRARAYRRDNPNLRWGQALFNALYDINPELADHIRGTGSDPFYDDSKINHFYNSLYLN